MPRKARRRNRAPSIQVSGKGLVNVDLPIETPRWVIEQLLKEKRRYE